MYGLWWLYNSIRNMTDSATHIILGEKLDERIILEHKNTENF